MNKKLITLIVLVLAVAAWLGYRYLHPDEIARIGRSLDKLCETIGREHGESPAAMAVKLLSLERQLCPNVDVSLNILPISGRFSASELVSQAGRLRPLCETLTVSISSREITIEAAGEATVDCTIIGHATWGGDAHRDAIPCQIFLQKLDGNWKFAGFRDALPTGK
jgi:hypothetical protein